MVRLVALMLSICFTVSYGARRIPHRPGETEVAPGQDNCVFAHEDEFELVNSEYEKICGRVTTVSHSRMFVGKVGDFWINQAPWLVYIWNLEREPRDAADKWAQGVIISKSIILTTATFITEPDGNTTDPEDLQVYYMMKQRTQKLKVYSGVREVLRHHDFKPESLSKAWKQRYGVQTNTVNDLAALILSMKLEFSSDVKPICVPKPYLCISATRGALMVTGYEGSLYQEDPALKISWYEVKEDPKTTEGEIMAQSTEATMCRGDEGTPLILREDSTEVHYLVGLNLWTFKDCGPGSYNKSTKFVHIQHHSEFINALHVLYQ